MACRTDGRSCSVSVRRVRVSGVIFTVVSQPGPVERKILEKMAPIASEKRRVGAGVALRTIEAVHPSSKKTAAVLLHGRGHAAPIWAPVLEQLAKERSVFAFDLPGFGHSGIREAPPTSAEEGLALFVDPVEGVLCAQDAPWGADEVVLVGHSLGGLVALEIALRGRVNVAGLVLIGAMGLGPYVTPTARAYLRAGPERIARVSALLGLGPARDQADPMSELRRELHLVRRRERVSAKQAFDAMLPLFGDTLHRRDRLREITVPTLLVWGHEDEAFPLPIAMDTSTRMIGSELEVMRGKHSPHLEDAAAVSARVIRFLDERIDSPAR